MIIDLNHKEVTEEEKEFCLTFRVLEDATYIVSMPFYVVDKHEHLEDTIELGRELLWKRHPEAINNALVFNGLCLFHDTEHCDLEFSSNR